MSGDGYTCTQCGQFHWWGTVCLATFTGTYTIKFPPDPPRLHPSDIEAIAQRVAELVRAK